MEIRIRRRLGAGRRLGAQHEGGQGHRHLASFAKNNHVVHHDIRASLKRIQAQAKWRVDIAAIRSAVAALPKLTTFGTNHPGMIDYCKRLIARLDEIQKSTEVGIRKVNMMTEWKPPESFLR